MKSSTAKYRTASTAVQSKAKKLPKINTKIQQEATSPIKQKLFTDNHSLLLHPNTSASKITLRARTQTEISTQWRPNQRRYHRVEDMGKRRLQEQLDRVEGMFKQMQRLRQSYGIVSLNDRGEEEQRLGESIEVPYDPQLHEMNQKVLKLKGKIEESLEEVFRICRQYPKLKQLIERLLQQQMGEFLVQNVRTGKIAAMKAQHRLMLASRERVFGLCKW